MTGKPSEMFKLETLVLGYRVSYKICATDIVI